MFFRMMRLRQTFLRKNRPTTHVFGEMKTKQNPKVEIVNNRIAFEVLLLFIFIVDFLCARPVVCLSHVFG